MNRELIKNQIKKKIKKLAFLILKPFIVPISVVLILIWLVCYITDIFYIGTKDNDTETAFKTELKYYTAKEYKEEEKKTFFDSVGNFLDGIFKKVIDSEWPVPKHTYISSHFGKRNAPTARCFYKSFWN